MPELPEVETIKRDLNALVNKKIVAFKLLSPKTASHSAAFFKKSLVGQKLIDIQRRGKLLILVMQNGLYLLIHLKMTGQLIYQSRETKIIGGHSLSSGSYEKSVGGKLPNKHTRAIFNFSGGGQLFFNDLRRFGYVRIADLEKIKKISGEYGIEPLQPNFTWENFQKALTGKKNLKRFSIMVVLM